MAEKNETTARVLDALSKRPSTTDALAKRLECSRSNVATILGKLLRAGRVQRERVEIGQPIAIQFSNPPVTRPNLVYRYSITEEGLERLEFLTRG
jgi:predicted ArsR family transcriptional regulator